MAKTRSQLLKLTEKLPACTATIVHSFADGWTVRHLKTRGDEHREGVLAGHCWTHAQELESGFAGRDAEEIAAYLSTPLAEEDPYEAGDRTRSYSLRDPDNIPRVSFYLDEETVWRRGWVKSGRLLLQEALGHHSSVPKPEYIDRLILFAESLPREVVFVARYFEDSERVGSVTLLSEAKWRSLSEAAEGGDFGNESLAAALYAGDLAAVEKELARWAGDARPGDVRVVGGLVAGGA